MKIFANAYAILNIKQNKLFESKKGIPMLFDNELSAKSRANICPEPTSYLAIIKVTINGETIDEIIKVERETKNE